MIGDPVSLFSGTGVSLTTTLGAVESRDRWSRAIEGAKSAIQDVEGVVFEQTCLFSDETRQVGKYWN